MGDIVLLEKRYEDKRAQEQLKARLGAVDYDFEKGEVAMEPEVAEKIRVLRQTQVEVVATAIQIQAAAKTRVILTLHRPRHPPRTKMKPKKILTKQFLAAPRKLSRVTSPLMTWSREERTLATRATATTSPG